MRAHGSIPAHTSADSLQAMVSQGFMRSIYTRAHPEGPRESTAKQQFLPPTDFTALWKSRWVGMLQRLAFWVCYAVLFFLTFFTTLAIVAICFQFRTELYIKWRTITNSFAVRSHALTIRTDERDALRFSQARDDGKSGFANRWPCVESLPSRGLMWRRSTVG